MHFIAVTLNQKDACKSQRAKYPFLGRFIPSEILGLLRQIFIYGTGKVNAKWWKGFVKKMEFIQCSQAGSISATESGFMTELLK